MSASRSLRASAMSGSVSAVGMGCSRPCAAAWAISRTLQASMKLSFPASALSRRGEGLKGGDGDAEVEGSASQPRDAVSHQGELTLLALVIRGRQDSDCRVGPRRQDWDSAADLFPGHSQRLPPLGRRSDPASRQANTGSAHQPGACASRTCTYGARTVTYVKEHRSASVLLAGLAAVLDVNGRRRTVMDDRRRRPGTELRRELRLEPKDARPPNGS